MYPSDYRYTKEHEWVRVEGEVGNVGITDYAQHELGDVVYVDLPKAGAKLKAGQSLGTVNRSRPSAISTRLFPAKSPRSMPRSPTRPNRSIKIPTARLAHQAEARDPSEVTNLMDAAAYEAFIAEKKRKPLSEIPVSGKPFLRAWPQE